MAVIVSISLILRGTNFKPEEITSLVGVQPSKQWQQGDLISGTTLRHKDYGWLLSTGEVQLDEKKSLDFMGQVRSLVNRLQPHTGSLANAVVRLRIDVKLYCVLQIEGDERPAIQFQPDVVRWLGELQAGIDVVTYFLP